MPVTSVARTVVDVARAGSLRDGAVVADSALRQGFVTPRALQRVLVGCDSWAGIGNARKAIDLADPAAESPLESISRLAMHDQGLPMPLTQAVIADHLGPFARADFLWEYMRVIGEADGLAKYEPDGRRATRDVIRAEKQREERLLDAGYEVVRWGWALANDPPRLAHRLRAAFARGIERRRGQRGA